MRYLMILTAIIIVLGIGGCASGPTISPFKVEKAKFIEKVKTLAVLPVDIPLNTASDTSAVQSNFNTLILTQLKDSNYTIIEIQDYPQIKERLTKESGGFYDSATGTFNESKYKETMQKINAEIVSKYHPDAILIPEVVFVEAHFYSPTASWDDTIESMESGGMTFLKALGGVTTSGTIPALSLKINIYDANDNTLLYSKKGGIQILEQQLDIKGFQKVPKDKILTDKNKNTNAIQIVLKDIIIKSKK